MLTNCQPSIYDAPSRGLKVPRRAKAWVCFPSGDPAASASAGKTFEELAAAPGQPFKVHRTGDVTLFPAPSSPFGVAAYRKRFWYPSARDRRKGWLRTTWLARSRVEREARNLLHLAALALQPPLLLGWGELRVRGVLYDSFLYTRAFAAQPLDEQLARLPASTARRRLLDALGTFVGRLHRIGFVDRDLHLRNLLADDALQLVKVDSPFGGGRRGLRLIVGRRRDFTTLLADLRPVTSRLERARVERAWRRAIHERINPPGAPQCRG